jgi:hypothetical protein
MEKERWKERLEETKYEKERKKHRMRETERTKDGMKDSKKPIYFLAALNSQGFLLSLTYIGKLGTRGGGGGTREENYSLEKGEISPLPPLPPLTTNQLRKLVQSRAWPAVKVL